MGPVGQIVKILFYMFLVTELVFSVAIYAMSTILLCSRIFIPEHVLLHGSIALFLSIVTLSVIHRGFNAVSHDCPFHLYWFAVTLIIILLIQFLFEMFGIRETSRQLWYKQQSLPIRDLSSETHFVEDDFEKFPIEEPDKMSYRVPTIEELEARRRQLDGKRIDAPIPDKKYKSRWNHAHTNVEEEKEIELPMYHVRRRPSYKRKIGRRRHYGTRDGKFGHDDEPRDERGAHLMPRLMPINDTEDKLTNTPLVLVFHGYSFILKMVCVALSILTGFMYQLEYI